MDKIGNFEEKSFTKIIITRLPRLRPDLCECVTSMSYLLLLLGGLGGGGSPIENLILIFLFSKKKIPKQLVTCDPLEKVSSSQMVLLGIFLKIRN